MTTHTSLWEWGHHQGSWEQGAVCAPGRALPQGPVLPCFSRPPVLRPTALPHVLDNPVWIKAPQLLDSRATNWGEPQDSRKCSPPDLTPVPKGAHTILRGVANGLDTTQDPFPLYPVVFTFFVSWLQHLKIKKLHVKKYRYLAFQKIQPGWIGIPVGTEKQLPLGGRTPFRSPPATAPCTPSYLFITTSLNHEGTQRLGWGPSCPLCPLS